MFLCGAGYYLLKVNLESALLVIQDDHVGLKWGNFGNDSGGLGDLLLLLCIIHKAAVYHPTKLNLIFNIKQKLTPLKDR